MKEYIAEKEAVRYSIAVDILREVRKHMEEETTGPDVLEMNQIVEEKLDEFFRRDEDIMNVDFKGSLEYDLQKEFVSKIEMRLKEGYGLVPERDAQGVIVFRKKKGIEENY